MVLAVAQMPLSPDPGDLSQLRHSGEIIRALMRQARAAGAHLVHFPEGALTSPHKRIMSSTGPEVIGPADWGRANWGALGRELDQIARLAGRLGTWAGHPPAGIAGPDGTWACRCDTGTSEVALAELEAGAGAPARAWRRTARARASGWPARGRAGLTRPR